MAKAKDAFEFQKIVNYQIVLTSPHIAGKRILLPLRCLERMRTGSLLVLMKIRLWYGISLKDDGNNFFANFIIIFSYSFIISLLVFEYYTILFTNATNINATNKIKHCLSQDPLHL